MQADFPRDSIVLRKLPAYPGLRYYAYVPSTLRPRTEPVVLMHGISRNAREQLLAFAPVAHRSGIALVAPLFSRDLCRNYQQLGWAGDGARADLLLPEVVRDFCVELRQDRGPFALFGHSGGAQFAHRFAMAYPSLVSRLAVCAAGYFTFPDPAREFPYGLNCSRLGPDARFNLGSFLGLPILVAVGSLDTTRDQVLRTIDGVDEQQGANRRERAESWVMALRRAASSRDIRHNIQFVEIPGATHQFADTVEHGLASIVWPWLTGPVATTSVQPSHSHDQGTLQHAQDH